MTPYCCEHRGYDCGCPTVIYEEPAREADNWPIMDVLGEHLGWPPEDDDRGRAVAIATCLQDLARQGDLATDRVEEMAPILAHALSVEFGDERDDWLRHASPEQIRAQTYLAFRDLLLALARTRPVVLLFEDLHWSDRRSLDLISPPMEPLTLAPLVCVCRPEWEMECWRLGRTGARSTSELDAESSPREPTPEQSERLAHPLLTLEDLLLG